METADTPLDASPAKRWRGDRVLAFVLSLVGATFAFFVFLGTVNGPNEPIQIGVSSSSRPGVRATLVVVFFDRIGYTRSASDPRAFDLEVAFWTAMPPIVCVLSGACLGWFLGLLLTRKVLARRTTSLPG
jgi:hypothetical protein